MKKKYVKPEATVVKLNASQALLTVCSTLTTTAKSGGTGATCKGSNPASSKCKKLGTGGDNAGRC